MLIIVNLGPTPYHVQYFSKGQPRPASYLQQPSQLSQGASDNVACDGISNMYQTCLSILPSTISAKFTLLMIVDLGSTPNHIQISSQSQPRPASYVHHPSQLSQGASDNVADDDNSDMYYNSGGDDNCGSNNENEGDNNNGNDSEDNGNSEDNNDSNYSGHYNNEHADGGNTMEYGSNCEASPLDLVRGYSIDFQLPPLTDLGKSVYL